MLLFELLFPPVCPLCGKFYRGTYHADDICPECRKKYPIIEQPYCRICGKPLEDPRGSLCHDCAVQPRSFDEGRALYPHEGAPKKAVYDLKFHNRRINGEIFGRELAEHFIEWLYKREVSLVLPVPLHKKRKRERGYNQAAVIARTLAGECRIPYREDLLRRAHATKRLKTLHKQERRTALAGAFEADFSDAPPSLTRSIVLVDDIFTTGATLGELASVCKSAGAEKVYFLTVTIGVGLS